MGEFFNEAPMEHRADFEHYLTPLTVPAKTTLLQEGAVSKKIYLVEKGCLRIWFNKDGKDITLQFFFENEAVSSMESFIGNEPGMYNIETLEESRLMVLQKKDFDRLMLSNAGFKDWFYQMILRRFIYYSKHLLSYIKNNPRERYEELLLHNPQLLQRIPQHYIASYLGITSVSLSRIRNRK
ncbi:MAG TPA: Crp/Fnr family transcriptional regulator [Pedobacter sp.]